MLKSSSREASLATSVACLECQGGGGRGDVRTALQYRPQRLPPELRRYTMVSLLSITVWSKAKFPETVLRWKKAVFSVSCKHTLMTRVILMTSSCHDRDSVPWSEASKAAKSFSFALICLWHFAHLAYVAGVLYLAASLLSSEMLLISVPRLASRWTSCLHELCVHKMFSVYTSNSKATTVTTHQPCDFALAMQTSWGQVSGQKSEEQWFPGPSLPGMTTFSWLQ